MRATVIHAPGDVRIENVPDPRIVTPTDAVVRVRAACVCGSDLWRYRGIAAVTPDSRIGHEFVGVVEEVGADVTAVRPGDFVIAPFYVCCGACVHCRNGFSTSCVRGGWWGSPDRDGVLADGGQGEYVRVPLADGTLFPLAEQPDDAAIPGLLTLSDVMGTGHHAALSAGVGPGRVAVVVGDGAVGLCGVIAAVRLGAERVVAMSRHPARAALSRAFGATDVLEERGEEGIAAVLDLTDGAGADSVLECVGTAESMAQALGSARPGGQIGFVGVPNGGPELPVRQLFSTNVGVRGGVAPVRGYLADLLEDVLTGVIEPGRVFDATYPLDDVAAAYEAMDSRRAIKSLLLP